MILSIISFIPNATEINDHALVIGPPVCFIHVSFDNVPLAP